MANERWEQQVRDVAKTAEEELRRVVTYINDEVVPDIRENGSHALHVAAEKLHKLAQRIDEKRGTAPPRPPASGGPGEP